MVGDVAQVLLASLMTQANRLLKLASTARGPMTTEWQAWYKEWEDLLTELGKLLPPDEEAKPSS